MSRLDKVTLDRVLLPALVLVACAKYGYAPKMAKDSGRAYAPNGAVLEITPEETPPPEHNTESYARIEDNPFLTVQQNPLSTFSIDVDTASYSNTRRFIEDG